MTRKNSLLQFRPSINIENNMESSDAEKFQNNALRPILKLQHEFLCYTFLNSPSVIKQNFEQKHEDQKRKYIIECLKSNQKLKLQIVQSIVALMTMEELAEFYSHKHEYQKRIISMATHRLIDGCIENK